MTFKKISLFLAAVLSIVLVFSIPFYNNWAKTKFDDEINRVIEQTGHMTVEERMQTRFGSTYALQIAIKKMLNGVNGQNAVVLLPPRGFLKMMKVDDPGVIIPEPAVFYYFTGYKAVTINSREVNRADWVLLVENRKMAMRHFNDAQTRDSMITLFKRFN